MQDSILLSPERTPFQGLGFWANRHRRLLKGFSTPLAPRQPHKILHKLPCPKKISSSLQIGPLFTHPYLNFFCALPILCSPQLLAKILPCPLYILMALRSVPSSPFPLSLPRSGLHHSSSGLNAPFLVPLPPGSPFQSIPQAAARVIFSHWSWTMSFSCSNTFNGSPLPT